MAAIGKQAIGSQHAGPARIGHDREPWPLRAWLFRENLRHIKEVRNGLDTQDTAPPERGIEHLIAAGESPGVRSGGLGASCFDYDDWLVE